MDNTLYQLVNDVKNYEMRLAIMRDDYQKLSQEFEAYKAKHPPTKKELAAEKKAKDAEAAAVKAQGETGPLEGRLGPEAGPMAGAKVEKFIPAEPANRRNGKPA